MYGGAGLRKVVLLWAALWLYAQPASAQLTVKPRAAAIHAQLLTLDTHLDTPANFARPDWDFAKGHSLAQDLAQVDLPRMKAGGLDGGFFAIYTPQGPRTPAGNIAARDAALIRAIEIREMAAKLNDKVALATTADDAARIAASGKVIVYQSIENAYPLTSDISLLDTFYKLGVRMTGVAHFLNNDFGDSATDPKGPEWHGLSPLGRQLVVEANRLGVILDASHSSDDVFDQLIALSRAPIILSHSGCKAVYDHPRNIDDTRLRTLAAHGGVIQIDAFGDYLAPAVPSPERDAALKALYARLGERGALTAEKMAGVVRERNAILARFPGSQRTFDQFFAHLLHALKLVGPDHVGIGLDWDGGGGVTGMEDVSAIPRITQALLDEGYSQAELQKIWSGNVLRVLRAAQNAAKDPEPEPAS
jgi:membrane dipeptidase